MPDLFADDPERLARFQREARVLASLDHPNIASIYGLEEAERVRALVLELVEGSKIVPTKRQGGERMRLQSFLRPWIVGVLFVSMASGAGASSQDVFVNRSFDDAQKVALDTGKYLLVDATAEWCVPCQRMDAMTWVDGAVTEWIGEHAIAVRLDVDQQPELAKQLGISALPTVIVWHADAEVDRVIGYKGAEVLVAWLDGVTRGEREVDRLREAAGDRIDAEGNVDIRARLNPARRLAAARSFEALQAVLKVGQRVKVRDGAGRSTRGNVVSISSNQLVIDSGRRALGPDMYSWSRQRWAFTEDVVRRIDIVDPVWEGALIGGGVAFGVALLAGAESSNLIGARVAGIAVPFGVAVGAVIDRFITQPIYDRQSQTPRVTISPLLGRNQKGIVAQVQF